jgi:hypothetical protein
MTGRASWWLTSVVLLGLLAGLPLAGAWLAGLPAEHYLEFPPLTRYVHHPSFSWTVFALLTAAVLLAIVPLAIRGVRAYRRTPPPPAAVRHPFPWWGWAAAAAGACAWVLAWTRMAWFAPLQPHSFSPLWLAYILVVEALCLRRTGRCLLTHRPRFFLGLFPASALFWWFFEYLNRFVQNWHYTGPALSSWQYFWYATLSFATVLPAVLGTRELIASAAWVRRAFGHARPLGGLGHPLWPWAGLAAAAAGLAGIGVWPGALFPLLWVAPLVIIVCLRRLRGKAHPLTALTGTDWTLPVSAALAALVCGGFWEMWNFYSLAKWQYSIPYVQRFHLFEMPLLGYAGYLPFGLECAAICTMVAELLDPEKPAAACIPGRNA